MFKKQRNILDYAIRSLTRRGAKNGAVILVFTFIIFTISSTLFLASSLKKESQILFKNSPEIIVQKILAGRHELIPVNIGDKIMKIHGVSGVNPRYWGYYYDSGSKANYTVIGISDEKIKDIRFIEGRIPSPEDRGSAAIGRGVADVRIVKKGVGDSIYLYGANGKWKTFNIIGIFDSYSGILTADLVILSAEDFKSLFNMPDGMATDLLVHVPNKEEAPIVGKKIKEMLPDSRPILRDEILRTYDAVFGWRSSIMIAIMFGALSAFIILAWDKATGLSADEKKEIGILKALGWDTSDIIAMKFWEGFVICLSSIFSGLILAYLHIFFLGAPLFAPVLKGWSVIYPAFRLTPFVDFYQITILALITIGLYTAATIIPSWRAAITEPEIVMRGQ